MATWGSDHSGEGSRAEASLAAGWICLGGARRGFYDFPAGLALFALTNVLMLVAALPRSAGGRV